MHRVDVVVFFFFNDTATTEIYTLSLHDALPISDAGVVARRDDDHVRGAGVGDPRLGPGHRSEEHTSELQSRQYLVCRLLLEKKNSTHYHLRNEYLHHVFSGAADVCDLVDLRASS